MPDMGGNYLLKKDKLAHAFVFLVLTFLMINGFSKQFRFPRLRTNAVLYALLISCVYAISLELMQFLSTARTVDFFDAVANLTGCTLGFGLFLAVRKY